RLQPLSLSASSGSGSILNLNYNFHLANGDNANVFSITNNRDPNRNQSFTYDMLNRILTGQSAATAGAVCWGYNYSVDNWGNRTNEAASKCSGYNTLTPADTAGKNRISGTCYDLARNYLGWSGCPSLPYSAAYTYDAENRIITTAGVTYTYDGNGNRVKKSNGTLYWGSGPLAESDLSGTMQREYVMFNGKRIARLDIPSGASPTASNAHYYFSDHLGSSNVVTDYQGTMRPCTSSPAGYTSVATGEEESDFMPYGRELQLCDAAPQHFKFTGKERDAESGLDNFGKRYNASSLGRFMTPDAFYKDSHVGDPQSWNEYSYVRNNPLRYIDPNGETATVTKHCVNGSKAS